VSGEPDVTGDAVLTTEAISGISSVSMRAAEARAQSASLKNEAPREIR